MSMDRMLRNAKSFLGETLIGAGMTVAGEAVDAGVKYLRGQLGGECDFHGTTTAVGAKLGVRPRTTSPTSAVFDLVHRGKPVRVTVLQVGDQVQVQSPTVEQDPHQVPESLPSYLLHRSRGILGGKWELYEQGGRLCFDCSCSLPTRALTPDELCKAVVQIAVEFVETTSRSYD